MHVRTALAMCAALVALGTASGARASDRCSSDGVRLSFTVTSRRNETGHRVVTAKVNSKFSQEHQEGILTMDVTYDTKTCNGTEELSLEASLVASPSREHPADYELFPGLGYYRLHLTPLTWEQARRKCITEGAHLAVINSEAEAKALTQLFSQAPAVIANATYSYVASVGFHDLDTEGQYTTIFGQSLDRAGYSAWAPSQPNNAGSPPDEDSDCGGVERNGKLNDLPCSSRNAYFCEQQL